MFPDVAERLALAHLGKEDTMSALITGEACWRRGRCAGLRQRVGSCVACDRPVLAGADPGLPLPCRRRVVHAQQPLPGLGPSL